MGMYLQEFGSLSKEEQAKFVWGNGRYLMCRRAKSYRTCLYAVGNFYVEIWYDTRQNSIVGVESFQQTDKLYAYLKKISLKDAF